MRWFAVLAAVLALAATACGGSKQNLPKTPPPSLAKRCGSDVKAKLVWFRAEDGTLLDGAAVGDGDVAVVLAHGYPSDICAWLPYAQTLAERGFLAFAFEFRGLGVSGNTGRPEDAARYDRDVVAAYDEARRLGADKVFLMGGSLGGAAVVAAGAKMGTDPAGIISLSGPTFISNALDTIRFAPRMRAPLLLMVAREDRVVGVTESRRLLRASGSEDKQLAVYPGGWHAWDLLYAAPFKGRADALVMEFLRKHSQE